MSNYQHYIHDTFHDTIWPVTTRDLHNNQMDNWTCCTWDSSSPDSSSSVSSVLFISSSTTRVSPSMHHHINNRTVN